MKNKNPARKTKDSVHQKNHPILTLPTPLSGGVLPMGRGELTTRLRWTENYFPEIADFIFLNLPCVRDIEEKLK